MVNPAGPAEMLNFRKLGLNKISTEKAIISTQKEIISTEKAIFSTEKEISCPRHLTRARTSGYDSYFQLKYLMAAHCLLSTLIPFWTRQPPSTRVQQLSAVAKPLHGYALNHLNSHAGANWLEQFLVHRSKEIFFLL